MRNLANNPDNAKKTMIYYVELLEIVRLSCLFLWALCYCLQSLTYFFTTGSTRECLLLRFFLQEVSFIAQLRTFLIFRNCRWNDRLLSRWKTERSSRAMRSKRWRRVEGIASKGTCLYTAC